ncbi:hypothetical protein BKA64DRAFT_721862 [Cadophora sp. MPI-SDFR-AT-0126]|nr:hypothetical protein BKA64DRAFT_721862 [Leotiomycetes sp. MPI-SDFR-AT-0126]
MMSFPLSPSSSDQSEDSMVTVQSAPITDAIPFQNPERTSPYFLCPSINHIFMSDWSLSPLQHPLLEDSSPPLESCPSEQSTPSSHIPETHDECRLERSQSLGKEERLESDSSKIERRRAQNRSSQRAFRSREKLLRDRLQRQVEHLENTQKHVFAAHEVLRLEICSARGEIARLQMEKEALENKLDSMMRMQIEQPCNCSWPQ